MAAEITTNILISGIGGQGALTMMEMLALAAEMADLEVRVLSRVSLARLGGAGICHLRLGPSDSPAIPIGEADILLALEMSEVLRILPLARRGGRAFVSTYRRLPLAAGLAGVHYPTQTEIAQALEKRMVRGIFVPEVLTTETALDIQEQAASRVNMLMLGVFCGATELLPRAIVEEAITLRLPTFATQNRQTFAAGWLFAKHIVSALDNGK
jgi:Pyruvate/2-oxoacid:ferredoxin oxidoreductase gamma subunit